MHGLILLRGNRPCAYAAANFFIVQSMAKIHQEQSCVIPQIVSLMHPHQRIHICSNENDLNNIGLECGWRVWYSPGMKSVFRYVLCVLVVLAVVAVGWVVVPYRSVLAQSSCSDAVFNDEHIEQYVTFATSDGEKLSGWFFNRGKGGELVICYAGNSCNAGMFTGIARMDSGRSYLMLNYRGYGGSSGRLKEANMVADACEALLHFSRELQTERVTLLGFSLGTGVAVQVAARMPEVDKIVLVAPFDSMAAVAGVSGLKKWILKDHFNSIEYAPSVKCSVHILSSTEDEVVRPVQTLRLAEAFTVPVQVVKVTGSHTDVIALPENWKIIDQMYCVE